MEILERIRIKAGELFLRYGIRTVTMDEIANQLGVSKKTIYQYYADKDSLVDAVMEDEIQRSRSECMACAGEAVNAIDEIFSILDNLEQHFANINPSVFYDLERFHHRAFKKFQVHKEEFICKMFVSNMEKGIAQGLYRPDINVEILARYRMAGIMLMYNQDVFPAAKFPFIELQREIVEHFLFGLSSENGYQFILKHKANRSTKPIHNETKS